MLEASTPPNINVTLADTQRQPPLRLESQPLQADFQAIGLSNVYWPLLHIREKQIV